MYFRLANISDTRTLAKIHYLCARKQRGGFMHQLGELFFRRYYSVILRERWTVVVCAVDESCEIVGFHSGTLRAEEYARALKRKMFLIGLGALPAILRRPSLLWQGLLRLRSLSGSQTSLDFVVRRGPRGEYWAWRPGASGGLKALECHVKWHEVMAALGAEYVRAEVDCENPQILKAALKRGARIVRKYATPDGRERWEIEYCLKKLHQNTCDQALLKRASTVS